MFEIFESFLESFRNFRRLKQNLLEAKINEDFIYESFRKFPKISKKVRKFRKIFKFVEKILNF